MGFRAYVVYGFGLRGALSDYSVPVLPVPNTARTMAHVYGVVQMLPLHSSELRT